MYEKRWWKTQS